MYLSPTRIIHFRPKWIFWKEFCLSIAPAESLIWGVDSKFVLVYSKCVFMPKWKPELYAKIKTQICICEMCISEMGIPNVCFKGVLQIWVGRWGDHKVYSGSYKHKQTNQLTQPRWWQEWLCWLQQTATDCTALQYTATRGTWAEIRSPKGASWNAIIC